MRRKTGSERQYTRGSALKINHHRRFSQQSDYAGFATIRVHNTQLAGLGKRNAWVRISSDTGCVYRTVRGCGAVPEFPQDGIELDYDTGIELGIPAAAPSLRPSGNEPPFYPCDLSIRRIHFWEAIPAHWKHPNPAYRVPLQISIVLGAISVALGVIGIILGVVSLM